MLGYHGSRPGQLASGERAQTMTRIAATAVPFGRGVSRRGSDSIAQAGLPASAEDVTARFRGISARDESRLSYEKDDPIGLVRKGAVLVEVEGTPDEGQAVYCRFAPNGGKSGLGMFRNDADGGTAALVPRSVFELAGPFPGLAWVRINLP